VSGLIRHWEMVCKIMNEGLNGISKHGEGFEGRRRNCI
jgi:hypothetical protein